MIDAVECPVEYLHELAAQCVMAAHQSYDMDAASKMFEIASRLLQLADPVFNKAGVSPHGVAVN
jgi:hypothetical protein